MTQTHFGYQSVDEAEKAQRVRGVFDSVAGRYDLMNDVLSMGLHRVWKAYTVAVAAVQPGMQVLDIAGGTGDLARAFAPRVGPSGRVVLTDINESMLRVGRDRLRELRHPDAAARLLRGRRSRAVRAARPLFRDHARCQGHPLDRVESRPPPRRGAAARRHLGLGLGLL